MYTLINDPWTLPLRYKITFISLLLIYSVIVTPLIAITLYYCYDVYWTLNAIRKKTQMKLKLEDLQAKIYDADFEFKKIKKTLSIEFFEFPLKEKEIHIIKDNFSTCIKEDKDCREKCSICYLNFKKNDFVTSVPVCGHEYHFECIKIWIESKTSCPCCRSNIRKNMIEHFHGPFSVNNEEKLKITEKSDINESNEISLNISEYKVDATLIHSSEKV